MPTLTPKLGLKKRLGNETVRRADWNENYDTLDQMAAREPFLLKSAVYNVGLNQIDVTLGPGISDFLQTIVTKTADSVYSISAPVINTSYYIYLNSGGTFTHNTTGAEVDGAILLWKVATGATLDAITTTDLRGQVSGSAQMVKDLLDAHKIAAVLDHPDLSVTTAKLADNAVTAAKVAADVATQAELDALVYKYADNIYSGYKPHDLITPIVPFGQMLVTTAAGFPTAEGILLVFAPSSWTSRNRQVFYPGSSNKIYTRYSLQPAKTAWAASTAYVLNDLRMPTSANENGFYYKCTTAGTSGTTEPVWPTTIGATVADGTAVWTCESKFWSDWVELITSVGGTMTGALTVPNLIVSMTAKAATSLPSTYPAGYSYFAVSSDATWPTSFGAVFTFIAAAGARGTQIFYETSGSYKTYIRHKTDGVDSWQAWYELITSAGGQNIGPNTGQTNALLKIRNGGNSIEFGHNNPAGYGSAIGANLGDGKPFLALNSEAGTNQNTFRTRGLKGAVLLSDNNGGFQFVTIPNANADNQTPTILESLNSSGQKTMSGNLTLPGAAKFIGVGDAATTGGLIRLATGPGVASASFTINASFDGTNWNRDDISRAAMCIQRDVTTGIPIVFYVPAGANPITWSGPYQLITNRASVSESLLTTTAQTTIASYTPAAQQNFQVNVYFRVVTAATNVTVVISYADAGGAQQNITLNNQSEPVGSYSMIPVFINAVSGTPIAVKITAGTANQVYASATIMGM